MMGTKKISKVSVAVTGRKRPSAPPASVTKTGRRYPNGGKVK